MHVMAEGFRVVFSALIKPLALELAGGGRRHPLIQRSGEIRKSRTSKTFFHCNIRGFEGYVYLLHTYHCRGELVSMSILS